MGEGDEVEAALARELLENARAFAAVEGDLLDALGEFLAELRRLDAASRPDLDVAAMWERIDAQISGGGPPPGDDLDGRDRTL